MDNEHNQFLSFFVAGEEYALGILEVKEIVEFSTLTKIPATPPAIRGVVNLRGRVVPVVDLALELGLPRTAVTKRTCIVMVEADWESERNIVGILADSVSQVMELPADGMQPPPSFGTRARVDCLRGMVNVGEKFVLVLDLDRVLAAVAGGAAQAIASFRVDAAEMLRDEPGCGDAAASASPADVPMGS